MLKSKYEALRDLIKRDIVDHKYLPGDTLPTEAEFVARYGANQSTVNKVVASLSAEGFVRTRTRSGSVVLPVKERKLSARLGIYVMRSTGHIFEKLNTHVLNALQSAHYFPVLINLDMVAEQENHDWLISHLQHAVEAMPEFIIVDGQSGLPFDFFMQHRSEIANLIFINRVESDLHIPSVQILSDYRKGGYLAARHLIQKGCRRLLAVLGHPGVLLDDINISHEELVGVRQAMHDSGIEPHSLRFIALTDDHYAEKAEAIFRGPDAPDGVFADADYTAYQFLQEMARRNIRHNRDYQLVGYFDTPWSSQTESPFTSVSINQEQIAATLRQTIESRDFAERLQLVEPQLIVRQ